MNATIALVPAFNEAGRIGRTVSSLQRIPSVTEIVVVDDGSTDGTTSEAHEAGACCLSLPRNVGKGGALNVGVGLIRQRILDGLLGVPKVLLLADGDLAATAGRLQRLVRALDVSGADMAIATLPPQPQASGFGLARGLASMGIQRFTGRVMAQPLSGQRALRWTSLPAVVPFAPHFGVEVAMTLDCIAAGLRIIEVEVEVAHRATGRDLGGILHRSGQALSIAAVLARRARGFPATSHPTQAAGIYGRRNRASKN